MRVLMLWIPYLSQCVRVGGGMRLLAYRRYQFLYYHECVVPLLAGIFFDECFEDMLHSMLFEIARFEILQDV